MRRCNTLLLLPSIFGVNIGTRQKMIDSCTSHITTRAESPAVVARGSLGPRTACAFVENRTSVDWPVEC